MANFDRMCCLCVHSGRVVGRVRVGVEGVHVVRGGGVKTAATDCSDVGCCEGQHAFVSSKKRWDTQTLFGGVFRLCGGVFPRWCLGEWRDF